MQNSSDNKPPPRQQSTTAGREKSQSHIPVMLAEILMAFREAETSKDATALAPEQKPRRHFFDGTFGRGGHTRAILEAFPEVIAWVSDQDSAAIEHAKTNFAAEIEAGRLQLLHSSFAKFPDFGRSDFPKHFDFMLLDLGVSSPQLDEASRGFSFYHDGPLDMRMDQRLTITAADLVNELEEQELAKIFIELGEVQRPFKVAHAIVEDRKKQKFTTTRQLASMIERVDGWRKKGMHPATLYFMALRLKVNGELDAIESALPKMLLGLTDGGRLAILTFHSLEDRIVKHRFRQSEDLGRAVRRKATKPTDEECKVNPRSRSAKLRVFERQFDPSARNEKYPRES